LSTQLIVLRQRVSATAHTREGAAALMPTQSLSWRIACGASLLVLAASPLADRSSAACLAVGLQRLHLSDRPREVPAVLAQEPMNTDVLAWWKLRDHNEAADPSTGRPEGLLTSLAWSVSGWAHQPRRLVLSVSSPRRAACTTTLRARWRTAPRSTPSLPPPTASSGWSLESRGLEAQNRDQGAHRTGTTAT
jgi:hypothetical protein